MLRKCYEYLGSQGTLAGEVPQQARHFARRGCTRGQGARSRVYIGAGELRAGSYELGAENYELGAAS